MNNDNNTAQEREVFDEAVPDEIVISAEQFEEIKSKIESLQKERNEYLNAAQRTQADFDNFRKRNAAVRADSLDEGCRDTITALLPVLDNFERALEAADGVAGGGAFADGISLVYRQFSDVLIGLGLEVIECAGEPFDPLCQEAMLQDHEADVESGTVVAVLQRGYIFKGKVIRTAKVTVRA